MSLKKEVIVRMIFYPIVTIGIFVLTKRFFPTDKDRQEREAKKKPKLPDGSIIKDPEPSYISDPLATKGGFLDKRNFMKKVLSNDGKYIISAITGLCVFVIGDRYRIALKEIISAASPAIAALPVPLSRQLLQGFAGALDPRLLLQALKEGLLSPDLTTEEKLSLVRKTIHGLIIAANTPRMRKSLLLTAILTVVATCLASGPLFAAALVTMQDLFTKIGFKRGITKYVVSIYQEYNAPFPKELYDLIQEVAKEGLNV